MILVKGYGQMCNNILQYAHLYAFGREHGVKVISMRFSYKYRYFAICKKWYHRPMTYLLAKLLIRLRLVDCIMGVNTPEIDRKFAQAPLIACGGWGCRYDELFRKYRSEIAQLFRIKPAIQQKVNHWMQEHPKADINLGVHIRRGDYKTWQGGKYFFGDEVYLRLIQEFQALHPQQKINVFICTNDARLNINKYRQACPNVYLSKGSGIEDLQLLSQCDYLMGVKSTFSLWASFYRDIPLYWIMDANKTLENNDFVHFEDVYMSV